MAELIDKAIGQIEKKAVDLIMDRLTTEISDYNLRTPNDMECLKQVVRLGDVILVEGNRRFSRMVMKVTNSVWSHSVLYVGRDMIVEVDEEGVALNPLSKYAGFNIRLCRPVGINRRRLRRAVERVKAHVGKDYDKTNVVHLLETYLFRNKDRSQYIGHPSQQQEYCSGLIARAFLEEGFEVLDGCDPSQIVPKDFDLSPNFKIVKFNRINAPWRAKAGRKLLSLIT